VKKKQDCSRKRWGADFSAHKRCRGDTVKKPEYCDLFLSMYFARCQVAETGTADLRGKLPE
jgi:hypothetical protein